MTKFRGAKEAFGKPGKKPLWTNSNKEGVGTAYGIASKAWFTLWHGIITEVYYPYLDSPQIRDLQFLISDGENFFHSEKDDLKTDIKRTIKHALGYTIINSDPAGRYRLHKEIINDPLHSVVLQRVYLEGDWHNLDLYVLCTPYLKGSGWGNNAHIVTVAGREILVAEKEDTWIAVAATIPFKRLSCGYVGESDGWQDLADNYSMDWQFDCATDGHVALTGQLDLAQLNSEQEFILGLAFGDCLHNAITGLLQSICLPFDKHLSRFQEQWQPPCEQIQPLEKVSMDEGNLYYASLSLLVAHEDKTYHGAMTASLSIPWGQIKEGKDGDGYHFVWVRDMVNSSTALLAAGNKETPLRALIYLAASQQEDGSFPQNFWLDGTPHWCGMQLDQVGLPILLARRLHCHDALHHFDPYDMVIKAASYLMREGPATQQERWEEAHGYSPSTLATTIAALVCAACFARERGDSETARFIEEYADFLECHIEAWTSVKNSTLVEGIDRHYIRILSAEPDAPMPLENPQESRLGIINRSSEQQQEFPAKDIISPDFLELVRYGIRSPQDPLVIDSLKVVDALLKTDTPFGPAWHRYNHDGYGQKADGSPFQDHGVGRLWPLLTCERAYYELAAGNDVRPYIEAVEGFASCTGMLPEQIWDKDDIPEADMYFARPTGSAMPLMWSHAEYIKLLRSAFDGEVFEYIPEVAERYRERGQCQLLEIWKTNRQVKEVKPNYTLRIQYPGSFTLIWSADQWETQEKRASIPTGVNIYYLDIPVDKEQRTPIQFTFVEVDNEEWSGRDFEVKISNE